MNKPKQREQFKAACPVCHRPIAMKGEVPVQKELRFWRRHNYDAMHYRVIGILCTCGYLVSKKNYVQDLEK